MSTILEEKQVKREELPRVYPGLLKLLETETLKHCCLSRRSCLILIESYLKALGVKDMKLVLMGISTQNTKKNGVKKRIGSSQSLRYSNRFLTRMSDIALHGLVMRLAENSTRIENPTFRFSKQRGSRK